MNYFEGQFMILSRVADLKVLGMTIQFEYYFSDKYNGDCNVRNYRWFLFDISTDVLAFEVRVFTSDLIF